MQQSAPALGMLFTHLQRLLHHVVAVLVLHHLLQWGLVAAVGVVAEVGRGRHASRLAQELLHDGCTLPGLAVQQHLLDHVAGKLVLAQHDDVGEEAVIDLVALVRPALLHHVLDHVVAVLVLCQLDSGLQGVVWCEQAGGQQVVVLQGGAVAMHSTVVFTRESKTSTH